MNVPDVYAAGRLDADSEGLLLLTDTGALARFMELPKSGFVRQYAVQLACSPRHLTRDMFAELREGLVLADDGTRLRPIHAELADGEGGGVAPPAAGRPVGGQQTWVRMALTEGKRREISIHITEIKRRLVGVLAVSRREQVWLKLEKIG